MEVFDALHIIGGHDEGVLHQPSELAARKAALVKG